MIAVTQERDNIYTIELTEPELSWVRDAAKGMGMERCSVLGASFVKGLEYYFVMLREIEVHEQRNAHTNNKPDTD